MAKTSALAQALALIDAKIAALQEARAAIESTQTAIAKVGRKPKAKEQS
jgi:hypothetical protein